MQEKKSSVFKSISKSLILVLILCAVFTSACLSSKTKETKALPKIVEVTSNWCIDCYKMAPVMSKAREQFDGQIAFEKISIKEAKKYKEYILTADVKELKDAKLPIYIFLSPEGEKANSDYKHLVTFSGAGEESDVLRYFAAHAQGALGGAAAASGGTPPNLEIDHKSLPTVVLFYTTWCGYCKRMRPIIDKVLAQAEFKDKVFYYAIDMEKPENAAFVKRHRLQQGGVPYFQYYGKDGHYVSESLGAMPEESFVIRMKELLSL